MLIPLLQTLTIDGALILFALVAHELGHILVARYFKVQVKEIGIRWTGPYLRRARTTGWHEVAICLAGAMVNLLMAATFWHISHWFGLFNLVVGIVNLLPISHSDGSHALEAMRIVPVEVQVIEQDEEQPKAA